jgi:hypothetical protein
MVTSTTIFYTDLKPGDVAGVDPQGARPVKKKNSETWTRGQLVMLVGGQFEVGLAATVTGQFAVVDRDAALADTLGYVKGKDAIKFVGLTFSGVVAPLAKCTITNGGQAGPFTQGTTLEINNIGNYMGHGSEAVNGDNLPTSTAATDIGWVEINPANWV